MYSKAEAKEIRKQFWNQFKAWSGLLRIKKGKKGRWLMNNTGIKQIRLKFDFNEKFALTGIEIDTRNNEKKLVLWEKFESIRRFFEESTDFPIIWTKEYTLDTGKLVSRIYAQLDDVSIYRKDNWKKVNSFFYKTMTLFEDFFLEYRDYLKQEKLINSK